MIAEPILQTVRIRMPEKCVRFVADMTTPYMLFQGGRGAMKTTTGAVKLVNRARHPQSREGLYRKNLTDLWDTTLKTLLEGDGHLPPILPPGSYSHNQQRKTIKLHGGGEIVYNGLSKGDASRTAGSTGKGSSLNLTGACFEEWVELTPADMAMFDFSVRMKVRGLENQVYGMCNPGPPGHFLAERFGLAPGHVCRDDHVAYHATIYDNPFIDERRKRTLARNYSGVSYQRYILGKWVGSDGLVYDKWDRNVHVLEKDDPPSRVAFGVDDGYNHPFVALRGHLDPDRRIHIAAECYETGLVEPEKVARVKALLRDDTYAEVHVDSASPSLIETFRREGINAVPCVKGKDSIVGGIGKVQKRLALGDGGKPRLTVDPSCTNLIREFETYEWQKNGENLKDKPMDMNDHSMDAIRYLTQGVDVAEVCYSYAPEPEPRQGFSMGGWR